MKMPGCRIVALNGEQELRALLDKIYQDRGFDFRQYREKSLRRRLERRLYATKAGSYREYMALLDRDSDEYGKLLDVLTINVSEFFRDPGAFAILSEVVLPEVVSFAESDNEGTIRIWSAGCASGEEPYSIAILLAEVLGPKLKDFHITVYATDIDEASLLKARRGEYDAEAVSKLPKELAEKYLGSEGQYSIRHEIKQLIDFRQHSLVTDEPFTCLDLVACRNVVIYFDRDLQEKVFTSFYRGLRQGGFLLLGKAETLIGEAARLFHTVNKQWRVYEKPILWQGSTLHHRAEERLLPRAIGGLNDE
jgi:chemotaxis methyl-accepting protein methylase